MTIIVRPLTDDGLFGFDQFDQFMLGTKDVDGGMRFHFVADVRQKVCAICTRGWEPTGPSIGDQARWGLIDEYVHQSCLARHLGFVQRADVFQAVCDAGIRFEKLIPIPNGYWGPEDAWGKHMPWYQADLIDHPYQLRIGHRKRVWEIVLLPYGRAQASKRLSGPEATVSFYAEAKAEFGPEEKEGITQTIDKRQVLLHAYGTAKMAEYVSRLAKVGNLNKKLNLGDEVKP